MTAQSVTEPEPHRAEPPRLLRMPGVRNLRDIGGYRTSDGRTTRWRTLLRSDALDRLPEPSQAALLDLGLRTVVDLRWPHEVAEAPSVFQHSAAVRYESLPLLDADPTPEVGLGGTYRHAFDERAPQLADIVRTLLEPDALPAVIGCAAGKDRTGVSIALILSLVGVPNAVIVEDYALSAEVFASDAAGVELDDWRGSPAEVDCRPEYMETALAHLEARHGGARALMARHGVGEQDVARLVELLTEPA
ncbi:MAG: tyrosine-protein phosphatase [Chloroflexota bacterium]|jgi:protein-tyrosine phosphatase